MDIVEKVRKFVRDECKKPTSKYGYEPFENHFAPVVKYAKELANELGADEEIVEISAWLHDIGSIVHGREEHHITGAKIAVEKLRELGYSEDSIGRVEKCIFRHRGSQKMELETLEEQILAEADSMSAFDNIEGIFKAAFTYEHKTQSEDRESVLRKMNNKWNQLKFEKSKEIMRPKFEAVKILLEK